MADPDASDCWYDDGPIALSILVPVRDEAEFIVPCLDTISPPPDLRCEVLVIDDGSNDATFDLAESFARTSSSSIKVLRNAGCPGKAGALNHGFQHARGSAFILLAGDDLLVSEALRARTAAVVGTTPMVAQCLYRSFSHSHPDLAGVTFPRAGMEDHIAGGAVSFNRAFAELYFPIPEQLPNEDTWLRAVVLILGLQIRPVRQLGLHYRIHAGNAVGPLRSFAEVDRNLQLRHAAYGLALDRLKPQATAEGRARLTAIVRAERYRKTWRWMLIPFLRGLGRSDRAVFLANSTAWLHALKSKALPLLRR